MECNFTGSWNVCWGANDSVTSFQRFKLLGLDSVSNLAHEQNDIKEECILQERSFFTKSHHLVQQLCKWCCTELAWYAFSSISRTKSEISLLHSWKSLWGKCGLLNDQKPAVDSTALSCGSFLNKTSKKKHWCRYDKNYYYFWKSNIPAINLIVGSRNMIKLSGNMSL